MQLLLATVFSFSSSSGPLALLGAHIHTACSNIHAGQELEEMLLLKQLSERLWHMEPSLCMCEFVCVCKQLAMQSTHITFAEAPSDNTVERRIRFKMYKGYLLEQSELCGKTG